MSSGSSHTAWDPWKTFNVTPEEAEQIRLRRKLRWAQKEEYLRREAGANFRFRPDNLVPGVAVHILKFTYYHGVRHGGGQGGHGPPKERIGGASNAFGPPPPIFWENSVMKHN